MSVFLVTLIINIKTLDHHVPIKITILSENTIINKALMKEIMKNPNLKTKLIKLA